ncbi:hypothetical protein KUTeg_016729 [Tegillarca granosa]|uniref:Uncharacterized protein n=1 Tax=Tegillarca granosa TaxID=220873 RepID=A0ABQ9ELQ3_TEGGR|nr:hypothetical protein KUTeg_016729 [Tegillarca granosa]
MMMSYHSTWDCKTITFLKTNSKLTEPIPVFKTRFNSHIQANWSLLESISILTPPSVKLQRFIPLQHRGSKCHELLHSAAFVEADRDGTNCNLVALALSGFLIPLSAIQFLSSKIF